MSTSTKKILAPIPTVVIASGCFGNSRVVICISIGRMPASLPSKWIKSVPVIDSDPSVPVRSFPDSRTWSIRVEISSTAIAARSWIYESINVSCILKATVVGTRGNNLMRSADHHLPESQRAVQTRHLANQTPW